jgi:hypothetical protein
VLLFIRRFSADEVCAEDGSANVTITTAANAAHKILRVRMRGKVQMYMRIYSFQWDTYRRNGVVL